ncbi:MAG: hypothetical protein JWL59_1160 [Chthoniobacteraceae bacterium]|nr:hypothetical protein [Chthoniobacteraceae bacterium]
MARQTCVLTALAGLFFVACPAGMAQSQEPAQSVAPEVPRNPKRSGPMSPEIQNAQRALEALTPEQLKKFQENFLRWSNLPPEEKKSLRDQDEFRRKKMVEDIESVMREAGLELTKEKRQEFIKRYAQERRKVEEQLRKEMEEKRRPLLKEIRDRLRQEFATPAAPAATVQP